ncbi:MAG: putative periplasmic iron-binding protein precursor [Bacteroidetes bacterium ADurb.Bin012]|nr:MAG: putative periplasmic iron-binding protein precursor [Bacteroidetes bacterium ADurb.Bin012]
MNMNDMEKHHLYIISAFILICVFSSCRHSNTINESAIAVSILPQKYFVEQIAGNDFDIQVLIEPGASHEMYDPTPAQLARMASTLIWFKNGFLGFEIQYEDKFRELNPKLKVVDLSKGVQYIVENYGEESHETESSIEEHRGVDPHYWLSVSGARIIAQNIYEELIRDHPDNHEEYNKNLQNFQQRLDSLEAYIHQRLDSVSQHSFMIFHPSLTYLARDFNIQQIAIEERGNSPSTRRMKEIVELARSKGITMILYQSQFDSGNAATIAKEIGGTAVPFDPMAYDWYQNMIKLTDLLYQGLNPSNKK